MKICIMGAGAFGSALEKLLRDKWNNEEIAVWTRGIEMSSCLYGADYVIYAVPAQSFRTVFSDSCRFLEKETVAINVAKGIELGTLCRLSQIAEETRPGTKYVALSGPSHAEEIARGLPTTVTVCSADSSLALAAQHLFMTDCFRVYTGSDMIGTEIGGAIKNVIALAAGICDGLGFGDNTKAALMTRGMAEITRLGVALGARPETFLGLTGFGDLIVTCTSMHSRNRRFGIMLGKGVSAKEASAQIGSVIEGITTSRAALQLAVSVGVDMPITAAVCGVLDGRVTPGDAVNELMTRSRKSE